MEQLPATPCWCEHPSLLTASPALPCQGAFCACCPWVPAQELGFLTSPLCCSLERTRGWGAAASQCHSSPFPLGRYLGDGRFHLESIMIANPGIPAYRYRQPLQSHGGDHPICPHVPPRAGQAAASSRHGQVRGVRGHGVGERCLGEMNTSHLLQLNINILTSTCESSWRCSH